MKEYRTDKNGIIKPVYTNSKKASRQKKNKIMATVIIALVIILGAIIGTAVYKNSHPAKETDVIVTIPETTSETAPATEAPAEAETETEVQTTAPETTTKANTETTTQKPVNTEDYSATMYPTTNSLNVRSAPDANSRKLGQVNTSTELKVTGKCDNGWYRIEYNGNEGYVSGKYISAQKASETAAPQNNIKSSSPYYIKVNRTQNLVIVYSKDESGEYTKPVRAMVCSVGLNGKTETGNFKIGASQGKPEKSRWRQLSGGVYGQYITRFNGSILFHSVPYYTQNPGDLEYNEYNKLGQAASLGCVRLAVKDAKWIYDNCPTGTPVTVYDSSAPEPLAKPTPIRIDTNDSRKGWDPTDPDPNNPWKQ